MKYELKKLEFGELIGIAFNIYFDNFLPMFLTSLLLMFSIYLVPVLLGIFIIPGLAREEINSDYITGIVISGLAVFYIIILIFIVLHNGFIVKYISNRYLDKTVKIKTVIKELIRIMFLLIGLSILVGLCTIAGYMLFIVPGIILFMGFFVATHVMVIENKGIIESMKRSWELTRGNRARIFGYFFVINLIMNAISSMAFFFLPVIIIPFRGLNPIITAVIFGIFFVLLIALTISFPACAYVLIYFNLRIEKEGFAIEHLANQFDTAFEAEENGIVQ